MREREKTAEKRLPRDLRFRPVSKETLPDLERFLSRNPRFRQCSCMRWRLLEDDFTNLTPKDRAFALRSLAESGARVGLLAYGDGVPIGWCSIAPRDSYKRLVQSADLARIDDAPVWSVVCFYVDSRWRRKGMSVRLLRAAVEYARAAGAKIIEGYPVEPSAGHDAQMGSPATFRKAGFREVTPSGTPRRVMRNIVG